MNFLKWIICSNVFWKFLGSELLLMRFGKLMSWAQRLLFLVRSDSESEDPRGTLTFSFFVFQSWVLSLQSFLWKKLEFNVIGSILLPENGENLCPVIFASICQCIYIYVYIYILYSKYIYIYIHLPACDFIWILTNLDHENQHRSLRNQNHASLDVQMKIWIKLQDPTKHPFCHHSPNPHFIVKQ